jgi:hypothetical protein
LALDREEARLDKVDTLEKLPAWKLILLGCFIWMAPYIFAWFTLKAKYPRWYRAASFAYMLLLTAGAVAMVIMGGDRWPINVENRSREDIEFIYKHREFDYWSSPIEIEKSKSTNLDLFHFMRDVQGIHIREGSKVYSLSVNSLRRVQAVCFDKMDCYLTYWGNGLIETGRKPVGGAPSN